MSMETKPPFGARRSRPAGAPGAGYEQRDANIPDLLKFGFWMAVVIAVTMFAMKWTFNYMERTQTVQRAGDSLREAARASAQPAIAGRAAPGAEGLLRGAGAGAQHLRLGRPAPARGAYSDQSGHGSGFEERFADPRECADRRRRGSGAAANVRWRRGFAGYRALCHGRRRQ